MPTLEQLRKENQRLRNLQKSKQEIEVMARERKKLIKEGKILARKTKYSSLISFGKRSKRVGKHVGKEGLRLGKEGFRIGKKLLELNREREKAQIKRQIERNKLLKQLRASQGGRKPTKKRTVKRRKPTKKRTKKRRRK